MQLRESLKKICPSPHYPDCRYATEDPRYNDSVCYQRFCCKIEFAVVWRLERTHLKHPNCFFFNTFLWIIRLVYLLESPRRGDSYKYTKRMFSGRIKWDYQWKITRSADFCADRIDVITNLAVITYVVMRRVHCTKVYHTSIKSSDPPLQTDTKTLIEYKFISLWAVKSMHI